MSDLERFLARYAEPPSVQGADEASTDNQIKAITLVLAEYIATHSAGTIVDIGAGNGVLLHRVLESTNFRDKSSWQYVAVEDASKHQSILGAAFAANVHKRVDLISIEDFYSGASTPPERKVVVVRNVFHELDIAQTAELLAWLSAHTGREDKILVQDLQVFPEAERGNACWEPEVFRLLFEDVGFTATLVSDLSKSGNRWFTLVATRTASTPPPSRETVISKTLNRRREQLAQWNNAAELAPGDLSNRKHSIAVIDFDLQRFALTEQVRKHMAEPAGRSDEAAAHAARLFEKHALQVPTTSSITPIAPAPPPFFRDRAHNQDSLEQFLRSAQTVTTIQGGALMGKSDLVREVLSRRSHGRGVVTIDVFSSSSVWNLLESYFAEVGHPVRLESLRRYSEIAFATISTLVEGSVKKLAPRTIVVIDHLERILSPTGHIEDAETLSFITMLARYPGAKVVLTSRRTPAINLLGADINVDISQPKVGRFPSGKHTVNVLDDIVNRAELSLSEYPSDLLEAIDQVPYLAVLAARVLREEGSNAIGAELLDALRHRLYNELVLRIVPQSAGPLVDYVSLLRGPVPQEMLVTLAGKHGVADAMEAGIIYPVERTGKEGLIGTLGGLRGYRANTEQLSDESEGALARHEGNRHREIANEYKRIAQYDDDPRWVTESYYHTLASGDGDAMNEYGAIYKQLLFAAGEYWFHRRKDYARALESYQGAQRLGIDDYTTQLRIAASLYRTGNAKAGESKYLALISKYNLESTKTSWIDSLLYAKQYESALSKLHTFGFEESHSDWVSGQFGRSYLGLHRYSDAVRAFEKQLKVKPDPFTFMNLARAYQRMGDTANHERVIGSAMRRYPELRTIRVLRATSIARDPARMAEAERLFRELAEEYEGDGRIMQQLCKLLSETGRSAEARALMDAIDWQVLPKEYSRTIRAEIGMAEGRWRDVISDITAAGLGSDTHVGLLKKAYLRWAEAESDPATRRVIAKQGLGVSMPAAFAANIPIGIISIQLAKLAELPVEVDALIRRAEQLNPRGAEVLRSIANGAGIPAELLD